MRSDTFRHLRILSTFVKPHKRRILLAFLFLIVNGLLKLPGPFLMMYLIDDVIMKGKTPNLIYVSALIIALSIIYILSDFVRAYYLFVASKRIFASIQTHLLEHVQKLPITYFNAKDTGYIMSRFVDDAGLLNTLVTETAVGFLQNLVTFLIGSIAVFYIHWKLALISILILPFFALFNVAYGTRLRNLNKQVQEKRALVNKGLHETLSGILVIKVFSGERFEALKMFRNLKASIKAELKTFLATSKISIVISFLGALGPLVVLCYGGYEIIHNRLTLGQLMGFNAVLAYLYGPSQALASIYLMTQRALGALDRVVEVLELEPEPGYNTKGRRQIALPSNLRGDIRFENVSFGYSPGKQVLNRVTFDTKGASTVAVVGESGAGKSTLMSLILRLYEPRQGSIYIDGFNIREIDLRSLRESIGVVSQETFLFNTSVLDNIRFGNRNATESQVINAAKLANAHQFISLLPEGYATAVGRMGYQLSAGQRQRIALARAILKDPKILILDEATSSIDSQSEELIWQALDSFRTNRTTLIISHRLSSIIKVDTIVLLNEGEVVRIGSHAELMNDDVYFNLYKSQFYSMETEEALC